MDTPTAVSAGGEALFHAAVNAGFFPVQPRREFRPPSGLDFHTLGFVVGAGGAWTGSDVTQFRRFLNQRELAPTDGELYCSLARAKEEYLRGDNRLFLCAAHPCCKACAFDTTKAALAAAGDMAGLPIQTTGCQGQCKQAPVISLRLGDRAQMFARVFSREDWLAVLTFVQEAVRVDSLLVVPGEVQEFLHDPVHDHGKEDGCLKNLRFLLGHFQGEGRCAAGGYTFQKEVIGTSEAGGRFIALRMAASYPLANGRKDVHRALVIIGPKAFSTTVTGRAYTDGGRMREYDVELDGDILRFADALPDHTRRWKRARKILEPTDDGYEERLEADDGDGFVTYYKISMRRVSSL